MSTTTDESPDEISFEEIDWDEYDSAVGISLQQILFFVSVIGLSGWWVYDHRYGDVRTPVFELGLGPIELAPNPTNADWLFVLTLVVLFYYIVLPLYQNPRLTSHYWREFKKNRAAVVSLLFLVVIFTVGIVGPFVLGRPEMDPMSGLEPPVFYGGTWEHPFGTARSGEDLLQIIVVGMRVSMQVGLTTMLIIIFFATAVGTTAAYFGGMVDEVLMRFVDIMLVFPTFFLIIFVVYLYGGSLFMVIVILGLTTWTARSRLVRSEALQRREEEFIDAAENFGASERWIITRHLVPNVSNTVITAATLAIPILILYEATLAFLGFGDPNVWSWGRIIDDGRSELQNAWWISTIPGVFLFLTVLAFNFLGDALRDALDPRHEGRS